MDTYEGDPSSPSSLHKYVLASADPVDRRDPTGHFDSLVGVLAVGAIVLTLSSIADAPIVNVNSGFSGSAFTVLGGPFLGGYDVNSYLSQGHFWAHFVAPGVAGEESIGQQTFFKVQMAAPYKGAHNVLVDQTITLLNANAPLVGSLSSYLHSYNQPPATNGTTVEEPALASGGWFAQYTDDYVTFADAPGGFAEGSFGDVRFKTTFYTIVPHHNAYIVALAQ